MKFMIAGLGSIGRRHLRNLLALGEGDILLYRSHHSSLPDDELAGFPAETDLSAALAHKPDAVIISNPTSLHLEVAIPAALAGCHLLLEKPISHSLDRLDELQHALQAGGRQALVGYQFRYHPGLRMVAGLLSEDAIGRSLSARVHWGEYLPGWHPWEDYRQGYSARADLGGGVILTISHPLDYLRWLFGEVDCLWAFVERLSDLDLDVADTAEIGLRFKNGMLASLHLDYNQRPSAHNLEIVGASGTLRWDNADGAARLYRAGHSQAVDSTAGDWEVFPASPGTNRAADNKTAELEDTVFERNELFLTEMRHFLAVVQGEAQPLCTLEDGLQALRLAMAAHLSAQEKRLVYL